MASPRATPNPDLSVMDGSAYARFFSQGHLFQDRVYAYDDWEKQRGFHRLAPDLLTCVRVLSCSPILAAVVYSTVISVFVHFAFTSFSSHHADYLDHIDEAYKYITFALSLLIVFKTNSSYSRWWEARKLWGRMFDWSRHLTRQVLTWFPEDDDLKAEMLRWILVASYTLRSHINPKVQEADDIARVTLTLDQYKKWRVSKHRPLTIAMAMSKLIRRSGVSDIIAVEMEQQVTIYVNCTGGCERIFKTPVPLAYTRSALHAWPNTLPKKTALAQPVRILTHHRRLRHEVAFNLGTSPNARSTPARWTSTRVGCEKNGKSADPTTFRAPEPL